jgi:hypothetical protein
MSRSITVLANPYKAGRAQTETLLDGQQQYLRFFTTAEELSSLLQAVQQWLQVTMYTTAGRRLVRDTQGSRLVYSRYMSMKEK